MTADDTPTLPTAVDRPHAPIVYFEIAPTFGHMNGMISVTLCSSVQLPEPDGVKVRNDMVAVAYLRSNIEGARLLRDALDKALLAAQPTDTVAQN